MAAEDARAVTEVLVSGHLAQGDVVRRFEDGMADLLDRRGGVATSSGTAALHLALLALGVGPGDEVILPSYTCVALLHAVRYVRATPVLVDIDIETFNVCPSDARRHITSRTKAIIVPHMFGLPVDLGPMLSWGIPLIEDCAQALGATCRGRPVGSIGTITVCSFYATKVITTGEGGMLLSDSEFLLRRARDARDYDGRLDNGIRFNYKMTDMEAALGLSQIRRLSSFVARRQEIASRYAACLSPLAIRLPVARPERTHIFYRYVVRVGDARRLAGRLEAGGVQCKAPVFQPLHRYLKRDGFACTETAMRTALSIPLYPSLTDDEVDKIVHAVANEVEREEDRSRRVSSLRS